MALGYDLDILQVSTIKQVLDTSHASLVRGIALYLVFVYLLPCILPMSIVCCWQFSP